MTLSARECEQGLKTAIAAFLLALLCWLLSGCTPAGVKVLCTSTDQAGKALKLAKENLTELLYTDAEAQWTVRCVQQDPEERRVCRHKVVAELALQYKARYNAEAQIIQAQRLMADGLTESGVCK